jgi:hypothetical protein
LVARVVRDDEAVETRVDAEAWLADERRLISAGVWSSPAARQDAMKRAEEARLARVFEDYAHALAGQPARRAAIDASELLGVADPPPRALVRPYPR